MGALGSEAGLDLDFSSVIVVGRKDYVLRSVHPQASALSSMQLLPQLGKPAGVY